MTIWVDADSCPRRVREIVIKATERTGSQACFVANRRIETPESELVDMVEISPEETTADNHIVEHAGAEDIAITRDIPLAARLVEKGITVLNDRGDVYTQENVRERLSMRDFMYDLRSRGEYPEKGRAYGAREVSAFANALDRTLQKRLK